MIVEADRCGYNLRMPDTMLWERASNYNGLSVPANWPGPVSLQIEPAPPPANVLAYFKSYAA